MTVVPRGTFGKSIIKNTNCSIGVVDTNGYSGRCLFYS